MDLCFQDFAAELERLPEMYGAPSGCLLLGRVDGVAVACVGMRRKSAEACEMKRLYVRESARRYGLGRRLALAAIAAARTLGYGRMVLDTLESLGPARGLYASLGFRETAPYYANPLPGVVYLALDSGVLASKAMAPRAIARRDVVRALAAGIPAGALAACRLDAPRAGGGSGGSPVAPRPREVANLVDAQPTVDGAGVKLRRALGSRALPMLDPFLLLDEIHSERPDDYLAGFPTHPHRGFETVTYVLHGAMEHRDSLGNHGHLGPGSAQWMTAGHGIVHSEMPQQEKGLMWGFQLWVNLPAANKLIRPRYQDIPPERVTETIVDDARVRLVAGEVGGRRGPVEGIVTAPEMLDVALPARGSMRHAAAGVAQRVRLRDRGGGRGRRRQDPRRGGAARRARRRGAAGAPLSGGRARLLCFAGRPIGEPVARYGPFVMNTDEEIRQAVDDYRSGRLVGDS